jgi:hypothetical protein
MYRVFQKEIYNFESYSEDMYSVLNCYNVAKNTDNAWYFKRALQWCSKCYYVASVLKTFTRKGVETIHHSRYNSKIWNTIVMLFLKHPVYPNH